MKWQMLQKRGTMSKNKPIQLKRCGTKKILSMKSRCCLIGFCGNVVSAHHILIREIKQKNEGGWDFYWDEDSKPGHIILEVKVAKFLDSSLINVDVHPTYISIIIKSKVLRLRLPSEVKVGESKCQRSKTSGSLLVVMPKVMFIQWATLII